MLVIFKGII